MSYSGDAALVRPATVEPRARRCASSRSRTTIRPKWRSSRRSPSGAASGSTTTCATSFKRGGTYHLLVFSGLQIALAAGVDRAAPALAARAARVRLVAARLRDPRAALHRPDRLGLARQHRASACTRSRASSKRPTSLENLWCVAALLRLVIAPDDLGRRRVPSDVRRRGRAAVRREEATRGGSRRSPRRWPITPLTLFHFHQYALGGSVMTLVADAADLRDARRLGASSSSSRAAHRLAIIGLLHRLCTFLNDLGAARSGFFAAPPRASLIVGGYRRRSLAIALLRGRARAVAIAASLSIPTVAALCRSHHSSRRNAPRLDVGQGDAILVRAGDSVLLVDGGPQPDAAAAAARRSRHPAHRRRRSLARPSRSLRRPSRGHRADARRRGLDLAAPLPRRLRAADPRGLHRTSTPIHLVRDGDRLRARPVPATRADAATRSAARRRTTASVVLRVQIAVAAPAAHRRHRARGGERARRPDHLRCDILKVAHHGSRTSTHGRVPRRRAPRVALISCGRHNLFGHPHPSVIEALRRRGVRVWRTDRDGSDLDRDRRWRRKLTPFRRAPRVNCMSSTLLRLGLWIIIIVLALYVVHETFEDSPIAEMVSIDLMQKALMVGGCRHRRRHRPAPVREGGEGGGEEPLRRLPHADPVRRDLLPRRTCATSCTRKTTART